MLHQTQPEVQTLEVLTPQSHLEAHAGLDIDLDTIEEPPSKSLTKLYIDDPYGLNDQLVFSITEEDLDPDVIRQNESKKLEKEYVPKGWTLSKLEKIKTKMSLDETITVNPDSIQVQDSIILMDINTSDGKTSTMEFSFFTDGIFKIKCINPANPSKFSFEMLEKPANLAPCSISEKIKTQENQIEIKMTEANIQVVVKFNPFHLVIQSLKDSEVLFEMNPNKCLKFDKNLTSDFKFHTPYIYGIPERADHLLLYDTKSDRPFRLFNNDLFGYGTYSPESLYGSIPIMVGRKTDSPTFTTLYWQNTSETYVEVHKTDSASQTYWLSERGNLECYIFVNFTTKDHFASLARLTGFAAMPQYFTLGYHQCRYSYNDEQELLHINEKFNEHEIPCDSITLDIDHTNGFRYFTFDPDMFPDPQFMQDILDKDGRKLICIADPHIRATDDYHVYTGAIEGGYCVQKPDGTPFVGVCFPGDCIWIDFLNEEARDYWSSQYSYEKYKHSTPHLFAWNDMNEPSVFEQKDKAMPRKNIHTIKSNANPEKVFQVEHREVHNAYGYCMHKGTYLGLLRRNKDQNTRPHVLSRAFFMGSQKWTTIWTGDTISSWEHLKVTVPMMLAMSLCGISSIGGDVGGFLGNPEPELNVRWNQLGSFMPFFRGHCDKRYNRREPWLSSKETYEIIKDMIKKKYKFLPYWYTCFEDYCRTGLPLLRPVWFNEDVVTETDIMKDEVRFMVGESLLVVPIFVPGQRSIKGFLKGLKGRWYDYFDKKEISSEEEIQTGLERIGVFVRGGHTIPLFHITPAMKSTKHAKQGEIVLIVALDENNRSKGRMYFDDGESFDFKQGVFTNKIITFEQNTLTWQDEGAFGFAPSNKVTKLILMGLNKNIEKAYILKKGEKQEVEVLKINDHFNITFSAPAKEDWKILFEF